MVGMVKFHGDWTWMRTLVSIADLQYPPPTAQLQYTSNPQPAGVPNENIYT